MKFRRGDRVNPVIAPDIEMLVDTIQTPERYHCHWFVESKVEDGWFGPDDIQIAAEPGAIGFAIVKDEPER